MPGYHRVLVLVDLSADSARLIERARQVCDTTTALHLLHIVEYVPLEPLGEVVLPNIQLEKELTARAREQIQQLADRNAITDCKVVSGSIKQEVVDYARKIDCDLIVVGNHSRQGLRALLNFTEDTVLHAAPCDVLAVHL